MSDATTTLVRRGMAHWLAVEIAAVLEAEVIRPREREAWSAGCAEGKRLGEWGLPGLPNPFEDEGGHPMTTIEATR